LIPLHTPQVYQLPFSCWAVNTTFCRNFVGPSNICLGQLNRRFLATSTVSRSSSRSGNDSKDPDSLKPKPKSTTSLRRSASASLPIRSNPTPTRSDIQTVFTLATAQRYLLSRIHVHLNLPLNARILHESWWVPKWGPKDKEGEVFVFGNGSFVCWGLDEDDARTFAKDVLGRVPGLQVGPLKEAETEELEFVMDPSEYVFYSSLKRAYFLTPSDRETRLQGDLIILGHMPPSSEEISPVDLPPMVLPSETLLARYAFSQALSRSTALSALEVSLDDYLSSMALLPHSLEQTGKPGMSRTALIKKLGQLMKFRQGLNLNRENFSDVPDFYWAEPELERESVILKLEH